MYMYKPMYNSKGRLQLEFKQSKLKQVTQYVLLGALPSLIFGLSILIEN